MGPPMSLLDSIKTALSGGVSGAATTFLQRTPEGRAIVGDTVKDQVIRLTPWLLLGGIVIGLILNKRR